MEYQRASKHLGPRRRWRWRQRQTVGQKELFVFISLITMQHSSHFLETCGKSGQKEQLTGMVCTKIKLWKSIHSLFKQKSFFLFSPITHHIKQSMMREQYSQCWGDSVAQRRAILHGVSAQIARDSNELFPI